MKNISVISATSGSNNTYSSSAEDLPSKAEGIALCSAFAVEAVFIVLGNLLTILLFAVYREFRKKSLFLVINMAFADLMLGAVSLPGHIYLLGEHYQLWSASRLHTFLDNFFNITETVFLQGSLLFAAMISVERFYAIFWPLKHRTVTVRAYRIVIFVVWTLAILVSAIFFILFSLIASRHAIYSLMSYLLTLLLIVCGCNIGIWRKFQQESIPSHQQNRSSQNKRLTKTLLFVSAAALLSWLPVIIVYYLAFSSTVLSLPGYTVDVAFVLCYSNSSVNPLVYALRIPEFRHALGLCCFRRQTAEQPGKMMTELPL